MTDASTPYRVLARTYRPTKLSELIGQEALVRALSNAMASGRIAHAFLLTGIRGVGKTTTARIIARSLNCTGTDGRGGPTVDPCGVCPSCKAIAADNSMDVIEMDAATRTGIDDIREIVEKVRYAPVASRFKVYIIDEVHMLSEKAFNGLLKTLEEPPEHAKFIFATTEARKVPVTVLSRCQRFDLRRIEPEQLAGHLRAICAREKIEAESEALDLIARAAGGSARDSLSLLDQAIALSEGTIRSSDVAFMLGLGDRRRILDLYEAVLEGRAAAAIDTFRDIHDRGAEPAAVLEDMLETCHWLSGLKIDRDRGSVMATDREVEERGRELSGRLSMAILARAWQTLLKGLDEVRNAPQSGMAAEMILLRLASMGDLPTPGELARMLRDGRRPETAARPGAEPARGGPGAPVPGGRPQARSSMALAAAHPAVSGERLEAVQRNPSASPAVQPMPASFEELVAMLARSGEPSLAAYLSQGARLVQYRPQHLELSLDSGLPADLSGRLNDALARMTGKRWGIVLSRDTAQPTLAEQRLEEKQRAIDQAAGIPDVRTVLEAFPGARIIDIHRRDSEG
ncbi:MAG: DNA polymerase III subunit gamma/tau [Geminicoccaceae bacterium]